MNSTLGALTKKAGKVKIRESTAEEWAEIVKLAENERLEYCPTIDEQVVDDQAAEETGIKLEKEIQLGKSTPVISKRKRTPRFLKTFGKTTKERLNFGIDYDMGNIGYVT